jgi:hypothetical protein
LIWLAGSALLVARFCVARIWLAVRRHTATPADPDSVKVIARWRTSFGLRDVQCQAWSDLRSPVAFGIFRPTIALPPDFALRFTPVEREAMLAHEMAHLAAQDPFWLNVSDAVVALAWWHPLIWWARRQLQFANEAVADEASALIPGGARALAESLVRLGRELVSFDPARTLGVDGMGLRSHLGSRIGCLLREPRPWQAPTLWSRCIPHGSAIFAATVAAILPIQTGLSGSILAALAAPAPAQANAPSLPNSLGPVPRQTFNAPAIPNAADAPPANAIEPAPINPLESAPAPAPKQPDMANAVAPVQPESNLLAAAAVAPPSVPSSTFSTSPTNETRLLVSASSNLQNEQATSRPRVSLSVSAFISENDSDDIGLDWIFGVSPSDNPALEISHDWKALRTSPPIRGQNLVIDRLHTIGQSAILKPEQFAALRDRIVLKGDILTAPVCITASRLRAHIAVQNLREVVTDVEVNKGSATNGAGINYIVDDLALGPAVDITPIREEHGLWRLRVGASVTAFIGYDKYGKDLESWATPGGKPITYQVPHPHFREVEINSDDELRSGHTLALRGPLWTETTKTKGHFLSPAKTKTVRERLYVFVTATDAPAQTAEK